MRRAVLQRVGDSLVRGGRRSSARYVHVLPSLSSAQPAVDRWTISPPGTNFEALPFPREGPGVNYALNWALAIKGVPPQGEAYRNLKEADLKKHGASVPERTSVSTVYALGDFSTGATDISRDQFSQVLKEVSAYLSRVPKVYVHDGAMGSSPLSDAKVRSISDDPSGALVLQRILERTPTSTVAHDSFPLTVYVASGYSPSNLDSLKLTDDGRQAFVAVDYTCSTLILGGTAFKDTSTVKSVLAALAAPAICVREALPLAARLLVHRDSTVLLFVPDAVVERNPSILEACDSNDAGVVWSIDGVARLFNSDGPNLYKTPASLVLITSDSTGAIPGISRLAAGQAGFHYLAGYNGEAFSPGYQSGPASVNPVSLARRLSSLLSQGTISSFLVNASLIPENELVKVIGDTVSEKLPKSKGKKPSEAAVEALKAKYTDYMTKTFPELPEEISM